MERSSSFFYTTTIWLAGEPGAQYSVALWHVEQAGDRSGGGIVAAMLSECADQNEARMSCWSFCIGAVHRGVFVIFMRREQSCCCRG